MLGAWEADKAPSLETEPSREQHVGLWLLWARLYESPLVLLEQRFSSGGPGPTATF